MRRYRLLLAAAVAALSCGVAAPASAQWAVVDVEAILRAETQIQHAITQIEQLKAQVTNQAAMLRSLKTDVTGPISQITGQATQILQQAKGLGYGAQDITTQLKSLYSIAPGATFADTQSAYAAWSAENASTLEQALNLQNQIARGQSTTSSQVAAAVAASQGAPGQTAAIQATNQLLATVSAQLTQLQTLMITQARAEQTLLAQAQASRAAGEADSARAWTYTPPASRVSNPGKL